MRMLFSSSLRWGRKGVWACTILSNPCTIWSFEKKCLYYFRIACELGVVNSLIYSQLDKEVVFDLIFS